MHGLQIYRYNADAQVEAATGVVCTLAYPEITNNAQVLDAIVISSPHSSRPADNNRASFRPPGDSPMIAVTLVIDNYEQETTAKFIMFVPSALLRSRAQAALANDVGVTFRWEQWGPKNTRIVDAFQRSSITPCTVLGWKACIWHNMGFDGSGVLHIVVDVFDFTPGIRKAQHEGLCPITNIPGYTQQDSGYLTDDPLPNYSLSYFERDPGSTLRCPYRRFITDILSPDDGSAQVAVLMADGLFSYVRAGSRLLFRRREI